MDAKLSISRLKTKASAKVLGLPPDPAEIKKTQNLRLSRSYGKSYIIPASSKGSSLIAKAHNRFADLLFRHAPSTYNKLEFQQKPHATFLAGIILERRGVDFITYSTEASTKQDSERAVDTVVDRFVQRTPRLQLNPPLQGIVTKQGTIQFIWRYASDSRVRPTREAMIANGSEAKPYEQEDHWNTSASVVAIPARGAGWTKADTENVQRVMQMVAQEYLEQEGTVTGIERVSFSATSLQPVFTTVEREFPAREASKPVPEAKARYLKEMAHTKIW